MACFMCVCVRGMWKNLLIKHTVYEVLYNIVSGNAHKNCITSINTKINQHYVTAAWVE